jgi:hypothetical protein
MKIQYVFSTSLGEVHEVLFDKLKRVQSKFSIGRSLKEINEAFVTKKSYGDLIRRLGECISHMQRVQYELQECLSFLQDLQKTLDGGAMNVSPAPEESTAQEPQQVEEASSNNVKLETSLHSLNNLAQTLKNIE